MSLSELIRFYETLTPSSVADLGRYYTEDAWFKDPFNDVHGVAAIQRIFSHMFRQVDAPRFVVTGQVADAGGAMLIWEFHFRVRFCPGGDRVMRGVSHLKFAPDGRVNHHRDYWDTGEELYMQLPGLGLLVRGLRAMLRA